MACFGSPWEYPGDTYWPEGTNPDETHFVQQGP
jgi:hypothetical protein